MAFEPGEIYWQMADKQKYIREIRGQLFLRGLQTDEEKNTWTKGLIKLTFVPGHSTRQPCLSVSTPENYS